MRSGVGLLESLPDLAQELQRLLLAENEPALAAQVRELQIMSRCHCGDDLCSTFYAKAKPDGEYRNVALSPEKGLIVLDVVDDRIAAVEVLYRDEIRERIYALFP